MSRIPRWLRLELLLGLALLGAAVYALLVEPFWLVVESPSLPAGRLAATLRGQRVALLSDLHPEAIGYREQQLAKAVKEKDPALLLVAGGLAGGDAEAQEALLRSLTQGRAAYAVLRPTEAEDAALRERLARAGVTVVENQLLTLPAPLAVDVIGVSWPGALPRLLESHDASRPVIVLAPGLSLMAPFADALLLEAARDAKDPAVDWRPSAGTWRFPQQNRFRLPQGGEHRVRLQSAISGMLIAELRFTRPGAAPVVLKVDALPASAQRGRFTRLPGSAFGREGAVLDAAGPEEPVTAAQLAPADYFETTVTLPAGTYQLELLARTRGQGKGAVWVQVEGAVSPQDKPIYQLGAAFPFPQEGTVDLIVTGGTLGGKVRLWTQLMRNFFPDEHPPEYWNYLSGLFLEHKVPLYVTRGVHTTGAPLRAGAPPELTLFSF